MTVAPGISIPHRELRFRFSRSGGPGGQNVNKRDTRVEVLFDVARSPSLSDADRARALRRLRSRLDEEGVLRIVADDERSQAKNRRKAVERLAATLAEALRPDPKPRVATRPSRTARERRLTEKRSRSTVKRARRSPRDDAD